MTRNIRFVGDTHGNLGAHFQIIKDVPESIHVGDVGISDTDGWISADTFDSLIKEYDIEGNHRFIRGNHDELNECRKSSHFIEDGTVDNKMMFIGGALSIDKALRTKDVDWWANEELSYEELYNLIEKYETIKPDIVVSHDCPKFVKDHYMIPLVGGFKNFPSRTDYALEEMRHIHQPKLHIYGHWHKNADFKFCETRYICLPINGYIDIDVDVESI